MGITQPYRLGFNMYPFFLIFLFIQCSIASRKGVDSAVHSICGDLSRCYKHMCNYCTTKNLYCMYNTGIAQLVGYSW